VAYFSPVTRQLEECPVPRMRVITDEFVRHPAAEPYMQLYSRDPSSPTSYSYAVIRSRSPEEDSVAMWIETFLARTALLCGIRFVQREPYSRLLTDIDVRGAPRGSRPGYFDFFAARARRSRSKARRAARRASARQSSTLPLRWDTIACEILFVFDSRFD
jgi:hypothetical protein